MTATTKQPQKTPAANPAAELPVAVCIVTGLSGAGKSTALKVFEDMGHFVVDGLPASHAAAPRPARRPLAKQAVSR